MIYYSHIHSHGLGMCRVCIGTVLIPLHCPGNSMFPNIPTSFQEVVESLFSSIVTSLRRNSLWELHAHVLLMFDKHFTISNILRTWSCRGLKLDTSMEDYIWTLQLNMRSSCMCSDMAVSTENTHNANGKRRLTLRFTTITTKLKVQEWLWE